jgi:hypothetical protein
MKHVLTIKAPGGVGIAAPKKADEPHVVALTGPAWEMSDGSRLGHDHAPERK